MKKESKEGIGFVDNKNNYNNDEVISLIGDIIRPNLFALLISFIYTIVVVIILLNIPLSEKISILIFSNTGIFQTVIITPIVEEFLKFFGYGIIFLINFKKITEKAKFKFPYFTNKEFIIKNAIWMSITTGLTFGVLEGSIYYWFLSKPLIEVLPHAVTHTIFIIVPVILWMRYQKNILYYLPIAIFLHSVSNLRYELSSSLPYIGPISILIIAAVLLLSVLIFFKEFKEEYKNKNISLR